MGQPKVELRQRMDLGQVLTNFFEFVKFNLKAYANVFLRYNGIFILLLLGISYMLVSGFFGMMTASQAFGGSQQESMTSAAVIGLGAIALFIVLVLVMALNHSLSAVYMISYVNNEDPDKEIDPKQVWKKTMASMGNIVVFILLLIVIYIGFGIISVILAIIPFLGIIAQYVIQFAMIGWIGIAFMVMLNEGRGVGDSFGEAWNLMTKNFWKCVGNNFILWLISMVFALFILSVPGIIIGFWTWHAVDVGDEVLTSVLYKLIYTIMLCGLLVCSAFMQSLIQFGNGVLYFSLNEAKYNKHLRAKIEQIGSE
ncbi:MAG: hypothetical protein ABJM06_02460 [Gilvibacter sp.]